MFSTRSISDLRIIVLHCQRESATFDMKSTPAPTRKLSAYAELAREHRRIVT